MGVINVTPDSFSDGGRWRNAAAAIAAGVAMTQAGAMLVDVGGESTRPGAAEVPLEEEIARVVPVVEGLAGAGVLVSVDTMKAEVAVAALGAGACVVNDVRGLRDAAMRRACAEAGVPVVLMHMQGDPRSMQTDPRYHDVVTEVEAYLLAQAEDAVAAGVPDVMIDPGIGFGKRDEHNLALLDATARLASHGYPLVLGVSRKSMIGRIAREGRSDRRLPGSLALGLYAASHGAAVLRVHDVAEHAQALRLWRALENEPPAAARAGGATAAPPAAVDAPLEGSAAADLGTGENHGR